MKTITFLRRHFLVAIALLTAGVTMSFKMAEKEKVDDTAYFYISEDMNEGAFHDVDNWTTLISGEVGCITSGERPCRVNVPANSTLGDVLGSKNNEEVLDISVNRKLAP